MNRFLINLRSINHGSTGITSSTVQDMSDPRFRTRPNYLGNIGESIELSSERDEADDEDFAPSTNQTVAQTDQRVATETGHGLCQQDF